MSVRFPNITTLGGKQGANQYLKVHNADKSSAKCSSLTKTLEPTKVCPGLPTRHSVRTGGLDPQFFGGHMLESLSARMFTAPTTLSNVPRRTSVSCPLLISHYEVSRPVKVSPRGVENSSVFPIILSPALTLEQFGKSLIQSNRLILLVEDDHFAAKILIQSLTKALGIEGDRSKKEPGQNGVFYRCVSPADVETLMTDTSMKDRFAFIVLDNDLGHGTTNYGRENAARLYENFKCPIIFNSSDYHRSRSLSEGDEPFSARDWRFGYFEGVFETVDKKGAIVPVLEQHLAHLNDLLNK